MNTEVDLKVYYPYEVEGLVRLGNKHDGGYVVHLPSLQSVDCLLNYGVGYNVAFEKLFHQMTGKPVYAFDPTLKTIGYIKDEFRDGQYYTGSKHIFRMLMWHLTEKKLPTQGIHFVEEGMAGSNTEQYKTLNYHVEKYNLQNKKALLKIDIEGSEYEVLESNDFYKYIDNMVQVIFEFHYVSERLARLTELVKRLEQTHTLIHIHANNNAGVFDYGGKKIPEALEVVFLHNDWIPQKKWSSKSYPVEGLDYPCNWRRKDIPVDFFK